MVSNRFRKPEVVERLGVRFFHLPPNFCRYSSMVECHVANVDTRVRFSVSAPSVQGLDGEAPGFQPGERGSSPRARSTFNAGFWRHLHKASET